MLLWKAEAQSFAVKRAEVEFHNFASLGEPERAIAHYAEQNVRRGAVIRNHLDFIGEMTPFLEIGSNVGHTSYMLANEFGASGFAWTFRPIRCATARRCRITGGSRARRFAWPATR